MPKIRNYSLNIQFIIYKRFCDSPYTLHQVSRWESNPGWLHYPRLDAGICCKLNE